MSQYNFRGAPGPPSFTAASASLSLFGRDDFSSLVDPDLLETSTTSPTTSTDWYHSPIEPSYPFQQHPPPAVSPPNGSISPTFEHALPFGGVPAPRDGLHGAYPRRLFTPSRSEPLASSFFFINPRCLFSVFSPCPSPSSLRRRAFVNSCISAHDDMRAKDSSTWGIARKRT